MNEITVGLRAAAVLDHVDLEEAGRRVAPVGEGAHRDAASDGRPHARAALALPVDVRSRIGQHTINTRRADLQNLVLHDRVQCEVAVPFHRLHQRRDQRLQALAAHAIGGFPQHRQRLARRLVIHTIACSRLLLLGSALTPKQPHGMLAVIAGHGHELVEDLDLLRRLRAAIPCSQCFDQLLACRHADSPLHVVLLPPDHPAGNKLREATGQHG